MARIEEQRGERNIVLTAHSLVGRSPAARLRIADRKVSTEHARLSWTGRGWMLRDLGSRNGTWLDGERIEAGQEQPVELGSRMAFGDPDRSWVLVDDGAPDIGAWNPAHGQFVPGRSGLLMLPNPDEPSVIVYEAPGGGWLIERDGGTPTPLSTESLVVDDETWQLHLIAAAESTWTDADATVPARLDEAALRFSISLDEEHIEVEVELGGLRRPMPPRSFHYMLLVLARHRRAEEQDRPETESGWLYPDEVCRMLRIDRKRLNVEVYRARGQFAELGIDGAVGILERRKTTRQLRFGKVAWSEHRLE